MLADFAADLILNGYSPGTARNYRSVMTRFLAFVGVPIAEVDQAQIKAYLRQLIALTKPNGVPRAASTVWNNLKAIRCFCRWAVANDLASTDVTVGIKGPRPRDRIIDPCQPRDVIALLAEARRAGRAPIYSLRNHALLVLAFDTGCRISELLGINVGDVTGPEGVRDRVRVLGKGQKERVVALNPAPASAIRDYLALRYDTRPDRPLFTDLDGKRLTTVGARNLLQRIRAACGLECSWHDARRTAHTVMRTDGVGELDLMALGGWSDVRMVRRYTQAASAEMALRAHREHSPVELILAAGNGGRDGALPVGGAADSRPSHDGLRQ